MFQSSQDSSWATHDECRSQMCGACGGRAGSRKVPPKLGESIKKRAQPEWSLEVVSHPAGICERCRVLLWKCEKKGSNEPARTTQRWKSFHLQNIVVPRGGLATQCCCQICSARRSNTVGEKGSNFKKQIKKVVTEEI